MHIRAIKQLTHRAASEDSGYIGILEGYAAVFESDSLEFSGWEKPWVERIARGAFTRSLEQRPDVVALWSHDSSRPIARAPDTLALAEDDTGLHVRISLVDTQLNRDTLVAVRSGLVDAMSFGFEVRAAKWEDAKDREIRTLLDVDLHEVSPVVWPAYPATSIGARSAVRLASGGVDELAAIRAERSAAFAALAAASERRARIARISQRAALHR